MLLSEQRDTAAAHRFFTQALRHGPAPAEVTTDKAAPYLRVLDELIPAALHVTEQYSTDEIVKGCFSCPRQLPVHAGRSRGQGWPEATRWVWP